MANSLIESNSPYLLQHSDNPVDWYPWSEEAFEKARKEDKPIFLSVGYAACHWCHVMAHESFEDSDTAQIMNEHFINIKVDREERPDVDRIYMDAVVAMTGQGGWPMSIFLTPDGKPFFGGTYFPPVPRYNMPSFRDVLLSVAHAWKEDRQKIFDTGSRITKHLEQSVSARSVDRSLTPEELDKAALSLAQNYDWKFGGWGRAPKFPQPMAIEFQLRRGAWGDTLALEIAVHALKTMAKGGMYDVVGGGFARYSTDDRWLMPHFEKMLYDNALLSQAYLHATLITQDDSFLHVCRETLGFVIREMTHPDGGFYSSLDADSEGEEGKFYVWTLEEIREAIADPVDLDFLVSVYDISEKGNFEGKNVLQRHLDDSTLAEKFGITELEVHLWLQRLHHRLLEARNKRVRPNTDDKILTSWNALMLVSFSEAARYLDSVEYLEVAMRNARFLLNNLYVGDRLLRSWRQGKAEHNAFLEDYASLILALLSLYQTDPNPFWFSNAQHLGDEMVAHFRDPAAGFFDTRDDHENLLIRPKELQDNATPSGNALASLALLQLAAYTGNDRWRETAESMLAAIQDIAARYPTAFSYWLCAIDFAINPASEVAILGPLDHLSTRQLVQTLWKQYRPRMVAAISDLPVHPDSPPLLNDRNLLDGHPTAYVCRNFTCLKPVTSSEDFADQLERMVK